VKQMKYSQGVKKLDNDAMFALIDSKKDAKVDEKEFLAFFAKCELKEKEAVGEGEKPKPVSVEAERIAPDDVKRAFKALADEEDDNSIPKEKFLGLLRVIMKVVKDTVLTDVISIKDGKSLRRLEVGEVVELLQGPSKDDSSGVERVNAKATKDGIEGWITLASNHGTAFLEEGGAKYKVVKETILTSSFELDFDDASTRKLKDTTRKLVVGELVEVREFPKKEEKSGLMRMRCKASKDGAQGWVTTVGNSGVVFLEMC